MEFSTCCFMLMFDPSSELFSSSILWTYKRRNTINTCTVVRTREIKSKITSAGSILRSRSSSAIAFLNFLWDLTKNGSSCRKNSSHDLPNSPKVTVRKGKNSESKIRTVLISPIFCKIIKHQMRKVNPSWINNIWWLC